MCSNQLPCFNVTSVPDSSFRIKKEPRGHIPQITKRNLQPDKNPLEVADRINRRDKAITSSDPTLANFPQANVARRANAAFPAKEVFRATEIMRASEFVHGSDATRATEFVRVSEAVRETEAIKATESVRVSERIQGTESLRADEAVRGTQTLRSTDVVRVSEAVRVTEAVRASQATQLPQTSRGTQSSQASLPSPANSVSSAGPPTVVTVVTVAMLTSTAASMRVPEPVAPTGKQASSAVDPATLVKSATLTNPVTSVASPAASTNLVLQPHPLAQNSQPSSSNQPAPFASLNTWPSRESRTSILLPASKGPRHSRHHDASIPSK